MNETQVLVETTDGRTVHYSASGGPPIDWNVDELGLLSVCVRETGFILASYASGHWLRVEREP